MSTKHGSGATIRTVDFGHIGVTDQQLRDARRVVEQNLAGQPDDLLVVLAQLGLEEVPA